jgi:hypothetical protein
MTISKADVARISELMEEGAQAGSAIADIARRIHQALPHLTVEELLEVVRVRGEELRGEAAELAADATASGQIAEILEETDADNIVEAIEKLSARAERGDERARGLLQKLGEAASNLGVSDHLFDGNPND